MIFYLLFFYLLSESMVPSSSDDSTSYSVTDKIICRYEGDLSTIDSIYDDVSTNLIPHECDIIEFLAFSINQSSIIYVNEEILKALTALNKPILLPLWRGCYRSWAPILGPDGNYNDAKILCDFATKYNILGYVIYDIEPEDDEAINKNIKKYITPYINQLKSLCPSNFIIGICISPFPKYLKNKDVYNFEEWNNLVTFYEIDTFALNGCNPKLYNGLTPITKTKAGSEFLYSLEGVVLHLKETEISFSKLVFVIGVLTFNITDSDVPSYTKMCMLGFDNSTCCAQTSENYYEKGKYFQELHVGVKITCLDWDDYWNTCGCKSAFNGFYNIYAGYRGGSVIPCAKFDVQSINYPIK